MRGRKPDIDVRAGPALRRLRGLAVVASVAIASPCLADVIEIAPSGAAVTYASPAIFTANGVEAIRETRSIPAPSRQAVDLSPVIAEAAARNGLTPDLVTEVAWRESRLRQAAVSNRDAVGVMQLTAATARDLGVDRYDVSQNILGGAVYLRRMMDRYGGNLRLALAAYNAGPGAVDRYRNVPPFQETQAYVAAILARLSQRPAPVVVPALFSR